MQLSDHCQLLFLIFPMLFTIVDRVHHQKTADHYPRNDPCNEEVTD